MQAHVLPRPPLLGESEYKYSQAFPACSHCVALARHWARLSAPHEAPAIAWPTAQLNILAMLERPVTQAGVDPQPSQVKQKFFVTEMAILALKVLFMSDLCSDPLRAPSRIALGCGVWLLTDSLKLGSEVLRERARRDGSNDVDVNSPCRRVGGCQIVIENM
jgi:hypothetical protein